MAACELPMHNRVIIYTIVAWIVAIMITVFVTLISISPLGSFGNFLISPFCDQTNDCSFTTKLILNIIAVMINIYMNAAWTLATAASCTIAASFTHLFLDVNTKVIAWINADGRFEGNLENLRQQHQRIARLVDKTDKFLTLYIATAVVCNIATDVCVLYFLIFNQYNTLMVVTTMGIWMVVSNGNLIITASESIKVNNSVSIRVLILFYV